MSAESPNSGLSTGFRAVVYGVLGGVMLIVLEFLVLAHDMFVANWIGLGWRLMLQWIPAGIAIAYFAFRNDGRHSGPTMAGLLVVFAAVLSAGLVGVRDAARAAGAAIDARPLGTAPLLQSFFYTFWITAFYGGLFMAACAQRARTERTRAALARAEIEHQRSETLLGEAALQALKARVDPHVLLRAVSEIARRDPADHAGADRLLDALVAFLRCAMPGTRDERTTLRSELRLAAAYGRVWTELDPHRAHWRIVEDPTLADAPFPGLWLSAALERWSTVAAAGSICDVRVRAGPASVSLVFDAPSPPGSWVSDGLERRLRARLHRSFGDAATLAFRTAATFDAPVLRLVLPAASGRGAEAVEGCARAEARA